MTAYAAFRSNPSNLFGCGKSLYLEPVADAIRTKHGWPAAILPGDAICRSAELVCQTVSYDMSMVHVEKNKRGTMLYVIKPIITRTGDASYRCTRKEVQLWCRTSEYVRLAPFVAWLAHDPDVSRLSDCSVPLYSRIRTDETHCAITTEAAKPPKALQHEFNTPIETLHKAMGLTH